MCCASKAFDLNIEMSTLHIKGKLPNIRAYLLALSTQQKTAASTINFIFTNLQNCRVDALVKTEFLSCPSSSYILNINAQRELRAAYGLIDCLLNGLQPTEKTALFGDLVSIISLSYLFLSYHALILSFLPVLSCPGVIPGWGSGRAGQS